MVSTPWVQPTPSPPVPCKTFNSFCRAPGKLHRGSGEVEQCENIHLFPNPKVYIPSRSSNCFVYCNSHSPVPGNSHSPAPGTCRPPDKDIFLFKSLLCLACTFPTDNENLFTLVDFNLMKRCFLFHPSEAWSLHFFFLPSPGNTSSKQFNPGTEATSIKCFR